jgi:hypothetical protein
MIYHELMIKYGGRLHVLHCNYQIIRILFCFVFPRLNIENKKGVRSLGNKIFSSIFDKVDRGRVLYKHTHMYDLHFD